MRYLMLIWLCFPVYCLAQKTQDTAINKYDEDGRKHGMWWQRAACPEGVTNCHEFGRYDHGRKMNVWYKLNGHNELLAEENYRNNTLDGASKYYDAGHLIAEGTYRGLNPDQLFDTIMVTDPETGKEFLKQISTDRGSTRNGLWKFYDDETGRLIKEEEYQVDELLWRKEYPFSKADSIRFAQRDAALPHNQKQNYTPPPKHIFDYFDFK